MNKNAKAITATMFWVASILFGIETSILVEAHGFAWDTWLNFTACLMLAGTATLAAPRKGK